MVTEAVETYLGTLTLDERGEADAAIARRLADRLDAVTGGSEAASVARELRSTLAAVGGAAGDPDGFVAGLFDREEPQP